jgi:signal transduction histidine kinase
LAEFEAERQAWRERMLRGVAWVVLSSVSVGTLWFLLVPSGAPVMVFAALAAGTGASTVALTLAKRVSFATRAVLLLAALYMPAATALLRMGFLPNPVLALGVGVVLATLLLGGKAGLAAAAVTSITLIAVSVLHFTGVVDRIPHWERAIDSRELAVGLRLGIVAGLLSSAIAIGIRYLLTRSEDLARMKAISLVKLRAEQFERERLAEEMERREAAYHKARELEILGRLAGTMAHDFNNVLLVISASLDELTSLDPVPSAIEPALSVLRAATEQATAATRQLRGFGGNLPAGVSQIAVGPLVHKAAMMLARVLPRNITLSAEVALDAVVRADDGQILSALTNLALNARDAMRDGGKLILRVRSPRSGEHQAAKDGTPCVVIEVEDTGTGMSEAVKGRLFEPYFTTKQAAGTGLGLASVRDLVEGRGGAIAVESTLGAGTTISMFWPTTVSTAPRESGVPRDRAARPPTVLVVDDDELVLKVLVRTLQRAGMTVLSAADGAAALVEARRRKDTIDVLCTDCVMTGLPVGQLIARFREIHGGRVLVCSGNAPPETGLSAELFDGFLPKPFRPDTLIARIHEVMAEPRIGTRGAPST